jgi:antitoxin PrlF
MPTVTVSEKGQVVIPAEIRRQLGITPGCQLDFTVEGSTIRVERQYYSGRVEAAC